MHMKRNGYQVYFKHMKSHSKCKDRFYRQKRLSESLGMALNLFYLVRLETWDVQYPDRNGEAEIDF